MLLKDKQSETPTQTTTTITTTEENKEIVYITKAGNRYHAENCFLARDKSIPIDKETAEDGGYKPCKYCIE